MLDPLTDDPPVENDHATDRCAALLPDEPGQFDAALHGRDRGHVRSGSQEAVSFRFKSFSVCPRGLGPWLEAARRRGAACRSENRLWMCCGQFTSRAAISNRFARSAFPGEEGSRSGSSNAGVSSTTRALPQSLMHGSGRSPSGRSTALGSSERFPRVMYCWFRRSQQISASVRPRP